MDCDSYKAKMIPEFEVLFRSGEESRYVRASRYVKGDGVDDCTYFYNGDECVAWFHTADLVGVIECVEMVLEREAEE